MTGPSWGLADQSYPPTMARPTVAPLPPVVSTFGPPIGGAPTPPASRVRVESAVADGSLGSMYHSSGLGGGGLFLSPPPPAPTGGLGGMGNTTNTTVGDVGEEGL